jgi:hypothetical protein
MSLDKDNLSLISPDDWDAMVNVTDDSLVIASDEHTEGLWAVTGDDPDGSGDLIYRVWFIGEDVDELPTKDVLEIRFPSEPTYGDCLVAIALLMPAHEGTGREVTDDDELDDEAV